jgi:hypothetical protein
MIRALVFVFFGTLLCTSTLRSVLARWFGGRDG